MTSAADAAWADVLRELYAAQPAAAEQVIAASARLRAAGGVPFEVVAGAPAALYGTRLSWRAQHPGAATALATAAGLDKHPWGTPDWIGLRSDADGTVRCKAYHRRPAGLEITTVHRGLVPGLDPVMAALDRSGIEVYATAPGQLRWAAFVAQALAGFAPAPDPASFQPVPRARARGFAMSARHDGDELVAVSLYAFTDALPDDAAVITRWTSGMSPPDRVAYSAAITAVGQLGTSLRPAHGLLAWSFDRAGTMMRAASLRVPPLAARFLDPV